MSDEQKDIPLAPQVPASTVEEPKPEAKPESPKGWRIDSTHKAHKGLKESLAQEIQNDTSIPDHWKNAILTEMAICGLNSVAMQINAHPQFVNGKFTLSLTISPMF
jgi:hypothetical protein